MKGVFYKEFEKRHFEDKSDAFDDFFQSVQVFDGLNKTFSDRLREIMLRVNPPIGPEKNLMN